MKLTNFFIRILFFLGISKKLKHGIVKYQAGYIEIEDTWNKTLPWFSDPDMNGNGLNNYNMYSIQYGTFTVRAKLEAGHKTHIPAVWMLYIDHNRSYEELDFELMLSPSRGKKCLYISSYINHKNSHLRDPVTREMIATPWQVRIGNQNLVSKLLYSYNNFTFEIRPGYVEWYINDRLIAKQKTSIRRPLYFILSNINVSSAVINT